MNTSEQLKNEAIKKAYGEKWNAVKDSVDLNGWTDIDEELAGFDFMHPDIEYLEFNCSNKWRPMSLCGIENNNGWIQRDEDSTFEPNWYWVKKKDGDEEIAFYAPHRDCFGGVDADIYVSEVTHFQLINKPKPPIF